jgi:hypothetical protein
MAYRVIEVQATPNPNALKFVLDRSISEQPTSFFNAEAARNHRLAQRLFAVQGVTSLLLLGDFITINKHQDGDWKKITRECKNLLENFE